MLKKIFQRIIVIIAICIIFVNVFNFIFPIGIVKNDDDILFWTYRSKEQYNNKGYYVVDTKQKALKIAKSYLNFRDYILSQPFEIAFDEENRVWVISGAPMQAPVLGKFGLVDYYGFYETVTILVYEDGTVKFIRGI